jgi:hypothetical protein
MSDLVEQVARAIHDVLENDDDSKGGGYMRAARAALSVLEPRIEALEAENFKLAAGACNVEGGLIGDDHGHFCCSLKARIEALERELGWQPIETAPKDGTRVLATDGVNVTVVEWKVYNGRWEKLTGWNHLYGAEWNGPVAWRPLPAAAIRNGERG